MQAYLESLFQRREELLVTIKKAKKWLEDTIDGHLEIGTGKKISFYLVSPATGGRRMYIPKSNKDLAEALASKAYAERVLARATRELAALDRYIRRVTGRTPEEVFSEMCDARKVLVRPFLETDEEYARRWENAPYEHGTAFLENKIYPTKKGDLVRSKSEAIIADMYYDQGIPYRYEQLLQFKDGVMLDPDFTVLNRKTRTVVYHEHFGKMDDPVYRKRNLAKVDIYRRHGIYTGKNMILTFEGDGTMLNIKEIRDMMRELFL